MKKLWVFLIPVLFGCSQRELPQQNTNDGPMTLEKHIVPEVVNPGITYFLSVRLVGDASADSVRLEVYEKDASSPFASYALYDDGANLDPDDGDQVAFDGYFSQNIVWTTSGGNQAEYTWRFVAINEENRVSEPLELTVSSRQNSAPVLLSVQAPDSLPSGFEGEIVFRAEVTDSNGLADIDKVVYAAYQNDILNFETELELENDGVYVASMDKYFAIGKKGLYELRFKAMDKSGSESNIVSKNVAIGNHPPQLLDFSHADSVQLPEEGNMVAFLITVRIEDDQSLLDVNDVKLDWKKPDGTFSQNSPFDLYDNGLPWNEDFTGWDDGWRGDETAGDGIYSITGIYDPTQPLGDYELTFYARDFAGNTSERITRIVTLYPREDN